MFRIFNKKTSRRILRGRTSSFTDLSAGQVGSLQEERPRLKFFVACLLFLTLLIPFNFIQSAFNQEINYQGKLTNSAGVAVADGDYNMEFKLYTVSSGGSAIWTETLTTTNKATVTNGLFSVLLGNVTSLSGVDFNQNLYLGVNIGGTGTASWDGEMTPRKQIASVPSAFEADKLDGLDSTQFLRSDEADIIGGNLDFGGFDITNGGTFTAENFVATSTFAHSVFVNASSTQLTVSDKSWLGTISGGTWNGSIIGDEYLTKTGNWTGTFDGQEGNYYLDADNLTDFGNPFYTFFNATTTDALREGSSNLYWTQDRWDLAMTATSSLPSITHLLNLTNASTTQLTVSDKVWLNDVNVEGTIENGLVGWWSIDEGTGTTITDKSTNGKNGTLTIGWVACGTSAIVDVDGNTYDTVEIGNQCWMASNLNVGTKITSCTNGYKGICTDGGDTVQNQTNNSTIEKYCYNDDDANCTAEGGLYQWDEMMQYTETAGTQGICPTGWHIPTDDEQNTLDQYLTDEGETCDAERSGVWDCDTAGTKLKVGGSSGFEGRLSGYRSTSGNFDYLSSYAYFWSSSVSGSNAWIRHLASGRSTVTRRAYNQAYGFSVRCLKN